MLEPPNDNEDLNQYLRGGSLWRDEIAPLSLPILLETALKHETISYTSLADSLNRQFGQTVKFRKQLYGQPIGKVGYALQELGRRWKIEIPPLSALVVRQDTQQPGDGADYFIDQYLTRKGRSYGAIQPDPKFIFDQIHNFAEWQRVADFFHVRLVKTGTKLRSKPPIKLPKTVSAPHGPEGAGHIELKVWASRNPQHFVLFGSFKHGKNEVVIQSGDRLDVHFENDETRLAIEVKALNASDDELARGIFQCIKYRAVLQATQFAEGETPNGQAVLLHQRSLPEELVRLAERLKVKTYQDPRTIRG